MSTIKIINFMGVRKLAAAVSILLIVGSITSLAFKGMVFGLDFTGGTQIEVNFSAAADLEKIRNQLADAGFNNPVVVNFGSESDVLIRLQGEPEEGLSDSVLKVIKSDDGANIELRRVDYVGPQVGNELFEQGGLGLLVAFAMVMLYVAVRYQYKFAVGAVLGLVHDVIIILGFFSVTGLEFDLTVLAAVLAVIGYSINDTIVISDRIRENFRLLRVANTYDVINESLTQTLNRTLMTSFTTLLAVVALYYFGGDLIHNFAVAMILGVFIGTYSSIYVSTNIMLSLGMTRENLLPSEKESAEFDGLP